MTRNFCAGVCATTHKWKVIQLENGEYPKLMTRTNTGHMGEPIGAVGDNNSAKQNNMLIFQDACTNAIGFLLVYGIVNSQEINMMMKEGDSSFVHLLPNVISTVQHCSATDNGNGIFRKNDNGVYSGSLVTIGFQMMENNLHATNLHMESIKNANDIISYTIHKIKIALKCK
uniref:Homeobox protein n=1 Tax=Solanum tuberosum TaxID=4113 RepID=M1DYL6_SOLTU